MPSAIKPLPPDAQPTAVFGGCLRLKYEEVYLNAYASVAEAKAGIGSWLGFYNE